MNALSAQSVTCCFVSPLEFSCLNWTPQFRAFDISIKANFLFLCSPTATTLSPHERMLIMRLMAFFLPAHSISMKVCDRILVFQNVRFALCRGSPCISMLIFFSFSSIIFTSLQSAPESSLNRYSSTATTSPSLRRHLLPTAPTISLLQHNHRIPPLKTASISATTIITTTFVHKGKQHNGPQILAIRRPNPRPPKDLTKTLPFSLPLHSAIRAAHGDHLLLRSLRHESAPWTSSDV